MRSNLKIFIFILSIAVYAMFWDGSSLFAERFLLFAYIPFIISLACQYVIDAYQNTALQIARISLLQRSGVFNSSNISTLHNALIPDNLFPIYIGWQLSSFVGFYSILFFQGWLSAILAILFSMVIFPITCSISPHIFPGYYYRVLCSISEAVQMNPIEFQQHIEYCSISFNDIRVSLDELVELRCNLGLHFARLMKENKKAKNTSIFENKGGNHSSLLMRYREGSVQCLVEPALARRYYCDLSDQQRESICCEPESATAMKIRGMMGLDSFMFLIAAFTSIMAFGYWSIAVIPLTWIYYVVLKGDASMGFRTFRWPIALCFFWWTIGLFLPLGTFYGTLFFFFLPLIYVFSLFGYRQASRAVMALAFWNKDAFEYFTNNTNGKPVIIVVEPSESESNQARKSTSSSAS